MFSGSSLSRQFLQEILVVALQQYDTVEEAVDRAIDEWFKVLNRV